jgi:CheY-like chemotaxis protein
VLEDEGYEVDVLVPPAAAVTQVQAAPPDLVVLDVLPYGENPFEVLDALREDEVARGVPIVAMSTDERLSGEAFTSYNVKGALQKPFDLDELTRVVEEFAGTGTLHQRIPPDAQRPHDLAEQVSHIFTHRSRAILFRWIQRLQQESPWRDRHDLGLADLLNHAPVVVETLDVRLSFSEADTFFERVPDASERVALHAATRSRQGISLSAMIREYAILRDEIWRALSRDLPPSLDRDEIIAVERAVNGTLDAVLVLTVTEYLGKGTTDARTASPEV